MMQPPVSVTQTFLRAGCAILTLNITPINVKAFPQRDTHKSGDPEQAGDVVENANIEV